MTASRAQLSRGLTPRRGSGDRRRQQRRPGPVRPADQGRRPRAAVLEGRIAGLEEFDLNRVTKYRLFWQPQ
jgi:hypothetical protein